MFILERKLSAKLSYWRRKDLEKQIQKGRISPTYLFTLHKSGSHLLQSVIEGVGFRRVYKSEHLELADVALCGPRSFFRSHVPPPNIIRNLNQAGKAKIVLNIRDPRDIALSTLDYFDPHMRETQFPHVNFIRASIRRMKLSRLDIMEMLFNGRLIGDYPYTIQNQIKAAIPFVSHPSVFVTRYEELAPSGTDEGYGQITSKAQDLVDYLFEGREEPVQVDRSLIKRAVTQNSKTKNKGAIYRWKSEGDDALICLIEEKVGWALALLGYD